MFFINIFGLVPIISDLPFFKANVFIISTLQHIFKGYTGGLRNKTVLNPQTFVETNA